MTPFTTSCPSSRYNNIAYVENQRNIGQELVSNGSLTKIAQIFRQYDAHHEFGIALLHRHHELSPGVILVHDRYSPDIEVSTIQRMHKSFSPCSFHLVGEEFFPYEFTTNAAPSPDPAFMGELMVFLRDNDLSSILAVAYIQPTGRPWLEITTESGTAAQRLADGTVLPADSIITEWRICEDLVSKGKEPFIATRACKIEPAGHRTVEC